MKIKAGFKTLKSTAVSVKIIATKLSEEILPLLFGMHVMWNVSPCVYLASQPDGEKIFIALRTAGYVEGSFEDWKFANSVFMTASKQLLKCPAFALYASPASRKDGPVPLRSLVLKYREKLLKVPRHFLTPNIFTLAPKMRLICKKVDSRVVNKLVDSFFYVAAHTTHDYSILTFEKYVLANKTQNQAKKQTQQSDW